MEEFNKELEEIKNELDQVKLSDEFKQNLKIKMQEELNKPNIKEKVKTVLFPRKLVAAFACFILVLTSIGVFADEIECIVDYIFSNTDKRIEEAIANGNYKKIDMEYVEHDGIGIKVDYIIQEDDVLSIAFNVKSENEINIIYFYNLEISNKNTIPKINISVNDVFMNNKIIKRISKNNVIVLYKLDVKNINIEKIKVKDLFIKNKQRKMQIFNEWEIKI